MHIFWRLKFFTGDQTWTVSGFHIISHYLKSIDSFYTKLGRWVGDLLPIIFTWKMSVNVKVVTSQWWRHVFATFEVFNMHIFYNVFERAHQGELKPERILSISQKLNEIWQIMKNNSAKYGVPPWEKSPNWSRNFVPANAAMLHMWCARWLKQK